MLRTFAKAGSYLVKDHETSKPVMNVNRVPIEEHLVMARKFVLEWMIRRNPPREHAVIRQLARIDLHIRQRWWRNYVDNPIWTFTKAIQAAEFLADNQWSFDYSTNLYHGGSQGGGHGSSSDRPWREAQVPGSPKGRGKGRKGKGGKGKSAKASGGEGGARVNFSLKTGVCTHNGQRVKCAKSKNGEWFCSFFNVRNNCRNQDGSCSAGAHKCNIMIARCAEENAAPKTT